MHELKIGKNDGGQRLDKFLGKALPSLPLSLLYKSIRLKKIKVNRRRADIRQILAEGDTLQLFLPEEFFPAPGRKETDFSRVSCRLSIVYEDENILLLNKRPGIAVHEDANGNTDTLLLHMQAYLYQKGEYRPEEENAFAPALCNRIDRNTGGIVIAAKNAEALREINAMIKARRIDKYYLCAVHGTPRPASATLGGFLLKDEKTNTVKIYDKAPPRGAKEIRTKYRVLAEKDGLSLLEVQLLTGRTHQIRAHLAHIGHPLLGDGKYGQNKEDKRAGFKYQALWSYRLCFHPCEEEPLLSYLAGKTFSVPADSENIYFLARFPGVFPDKKGDEGH